MFLVDDNGPGIEPDRRERVLTAFESSQVNGTGLGLTISRDIVRAHGGELTLEDSPQGGLRVRGYPAALGNQRELPEPKWPGP
jgi:two-component system osmolarity sensor histidine kinase EnvZ